MRITNAPGTASEGATINLGVQYIDDLGIVQSTIPAGTFLRWSVTEGNTFLGVFQTTSQDPTFPFSTDIALDDGQYKITLNAFQLGSPITGDSTAITIFNEPPQVTVPPDQTVEIGQPVTLNGSFFDPGRKDNHEFGWEITFNGEPVAAKDGPSIQFLPNQVGTYLGTFSVLDDDGGFGFGTVTIIVKPLPITANAGPDQVVTVGAAVNLLGEFADPNNALTHTLTWQVFAGGLEVAAGEGAVFTFTPSAPGTYTAVFTVANELGASATDSATIVVDPAVILPGPGDTTPVPGGTSSPNDPSFVTLGGSPPPFVGPLPQGSFPGLPGSVFVGFVTPPGQPFIKPRLDGGGPDLGFSSGPALAQTIPSSPIVLSELSTAGLGTDSERMQNVLPVEVSPVTVGAGPRTVSARQDGGRGEAGGVHDHVRTKLLQSVIAPTVEDDSVGIVEALMNGPGTDAAAVVTPQGPGVSALPPSRSSTPGVVDTQESLARVEQQTQPTWSWVAGALLIFVPMLAAAWSDLRHTGSSSVVP